REILLARARRVVRKVDYFEVVRLRVANNLDALSQDVFPCPLELPQQLRIADRNLEDHAARATLQRFVDVGGDGSHECVDLGGRRNIREQTDGIEVVVGDRGHTRLAAIYSNTVD